MTRTLLIALIVLNAADIAIHVAADRVEPIRVAANALIMAAAALALMPATRAFGQPAVFASAAAYAALNGWFVFTSGIGGLGAVLIASTIALSAGYLLTARAART